MFEKKILKLRNENIKLKKYIYKTFGGYKRHSVVMMKEVSKNKDKGNLFDSPIKNIRYQNYKHKSHIKQSNLSNKAKLETRFEEFCKNVISNKNDVKEKYNKKVLILDNEESINSHSQSILNLKKTFDKKMESSKNILFKDNQQINIKSDNIINLKRHKTNIYFKNKRRNKKKKNKNELKEDKYAKIFKLYSSKDPSGLLALINDIKEPFNKKSILNTFNYPIIEKINEKYSSLEKKLCQSISKFNFSN